MKHVEHQVQPCDRDCPLYPSNGEVKYVLEINSGLARENEINVADEAKVVLQ